MRKRCCRCGQVIVATLILFLSGLADAPHLKCLNFSPIRLQHFGIKSFANRDNIGIWVQNGAKKEKIASIGIKIGQMVTTHGFALNVCTNLDKFSVIVPCGISDFGVCSMSSLGVNVDMHDIDKTLLLTIKKNLDL